MSGNVIELTATNFETEALRSVKPVLVDFWAPWCAPCRTVGPIIEDLAGRYSGKVKVAKLNAHDNPDVAERYGVMSIPTILLFRNGEVVHRMVGAASKKEFEKLLADHA
jgi:thioredoxin 1